MRAWTPRERLFLTVTIGVIVVYALSRGWGYVAERFDRLEQRIRRNDRRLRQSLRVIRQRADVLKAYRALGQRFRQTGTDEEQMSALVAHVQQTARRHQLRFSEMKPLEVKRMDLYKVFPLRLRLEGGLGPIKRFLSALQQGEGVFFVDRLRIERRSQAADRLMVSVVVSRIFLNE